MGFHGIGFFGIFREMGKWVGDEIALTMIQMSGGKGWLDDFGLEGIST